MGCHSARKCTGVGSQVTCGNCGAGFSNDGAKGCKATCTPSVCREHRGASPDKPGAGSRDDDCCGTRGNTGCDVGYVHSIIKDAEWAKIGGRPAGFKNCDVLGGATCCTKGVDPCKTNNGGCNAKRAYTSTGGVATCGDCRAPLINDGAKGCKVDAICVPSVCREHHGASPDKPGAGSRDDDCCGRTGNTGCDVGYVHSQIKDAEWAQYGGRLPGFKNCDVLGGVTCCTKGVDPCKTNNGGCHSARKCKTTRRKVTCGDCGDGFSNDGATGCKATCTLSACREHHGASPDKPGAGSRDPDCCGSRGNTGCDVGYVYSKIKDAEWAKIGGRPAGFKNCDFYGGATCCKKV